MPQMHQQSNRTTHPQSLVGRVLQKVKTDRVERCMVVVPNWPSQPWYTKLTKMMVSEPKIIKPAHSTRSATTSKAKLRKVPMEHIVRNAGWANARTFANHYDKTVIEDINLLEALTN
ncbi:uncharacterized protein [Clytia hemisphaerica]|uniref:uncharacterized protein isoform X2 n=1 Tax=Clytia hemisphaerica TaxID=252671 RepID=UPI0034D6EF13